MSWIAGILRFDGANAGQEQLAPMLNELSQRPHDDAASWHAGPTGLVHLALRVTPEDHLDSQPLHHSDSNTSMVFDGRVDNRQELAEKLGLAGKDLKQRPDSELALHAWLKWGEDCCLHLLGDFAFAIWDAANHKLALFRDHIGLRPLFYTQTSDYFAFASHSAALRALPGVDTTMDERWVADSLSFLHQQCELTAYRGIKRLSGAHLLTIHSDRRQKQRRYWSLKDEQRQIRHASQQDYYDEFLEKLDHAVTARLRGNGPSASMLSGGLDSSAITALAAQNLTTQNRPLVAVSSLLSEDHQGQEQDERAFLEAFLEKYPNLDWRPLSAKGQTALSEIPALLHACDHPSRDLLYFMTLALMQNAQQAGARTIMSGFGGDFFVSATLNDALLEMLLCGQPITAIRTCLQEAARQNLPLPRALRVAFINRLRGKLGQLKQSLKRKDLVRSSLPTVLDPAFIEQSGLAEHLDVYYREQTSAFLSNQKKAANLLASGLMTECLYAMSLTGKSTGLDVTLPLLDKSLVSYCVNLPLSVRRHGGLQRSLLREATRHLLPGKIANRTCKGAFIPDMTRRNYQAAANVLPKYENGEKPLPHWLDFSAIKEGFEAMDTSASGFRQNGNHLAQVIAPLLMAEFHAHRWP